MRRSIVSNDGEELKLEMYDFSVKNNTSNIKSVRVLDINSPQTNKQSPSQM